MYVKYPLSLRNVEDLLAERGIDISHETVRFWRNRFGPMFAAEIRKRRVAHMRGYPQWRWHLDEAFVKVNGKLCYLWRAVDHEGEVLEAVVSLVVAREAVNRDRMSKAECERLRSRFPQRISIRSGISSPTPPGANSFHRRRSSPTRFATACRSCCRRRRGKSTNSLAGTFWWT